LDSIFITGTAGAGKSLLTSKIVQWYNDNKAFAITLNLDPGVIELPYSPDVDIRNYVNIQQLMSDYGLGPNGSLIMAADLVATKMDDLQREVDMLNPDYVVVDTAGQMELFVYRNSGPYFVSNFKSDNKANVFTLDGALISNPMNYVSIGLLAASIRMRLKISQVDVITKKDLIMREVRNILKWSSSRVTLEEAIDSDTQYERSTADYRILSKDILQALYRIGVIHSPILYSSMTMDGMVNLTGALSRIFTRGEQTYD
jgi:GTPase SAR1 family protein